MASDREKILQSAQRYVDKKKYDRAIAEYQRLVQQDPSDARTLLKIGDLQARLGAYPDAIATYDRVGQYYSSQGYALKAIAVYKQIRELINQHAPELADRYAYIVPKLAETYTQLGLTGEALQAYDEVATRLQKSGRDREAIDVFRRMVELDADNPLPHLRLAEACCRVQSVEDAIESFWTAADLLLSMERHDDALKVVERILHFKQDPRFARVAAELYLRQNTREAGMQALARLQICFQANPKDLDTLALLAQAFTTIGQQAKAIEVYKEMARTAREQNETDMFRQLLAHLREVAPHDEQIRALESLPPAPKTSQPPPRISNAPQLPYVPPSASQPPVSAGAEISDEDIEIIEDEAESAPASEPAPRQHSSVPQRPFMASAPEVSIEPGESDDLEADVALDTDAPETALPSRGTILPAGDTARADATGFTSEGFDATAHAKKAIIDAESFRKLRLYSKAIEALRRALEIDPTSLQIRYKLRELFVEAGDRDWAIAETLNMARLYVERDEPDRAKQLVFEILEIEPEHELALALLKQVSPSNYGQLGGAAAEPSAPLDQPPDDLDAPFGSATGPQAAMASYSLETGDDLMAGLDIPAADSESSRADREEHEPQAPTTDDEAIDETLREALDEADFFSSRGLYEDARAILSEQLARLPHSELLKGRLERLDQFGGNELDSAPEETKQRPISLRPRADRAFDIAASLEALDGLKAEDAPLDQSLSGIDGEVDVDRVFQKFKEGVRAQVSEADSATHYDLGVAYKEMGLIVDAISEFELAGRDPQRACMCYAMIGMIRTERRELDAAIEAYTKALEAPHKTLEQEVGLYYDLGNAHELKQEPKEALYYFQSVARRDPGYRDVHERIEALKTESRRPSMRSVNTDDEFDRVFDDLFDNS